jgi:hypothetical protein
MLKMSAPCACDIANFGQLEIRLFVEKLFVFPGELG